MNTIMVRDGVIPSSYDSRDYQFRDLVLQVKPQIYPKVDLRMFDSNVRNQGQQGSCTAFSTTGIRQIELSARLDQHYTLSPAFTYYMTRREYGDVNVDNGASLRDVMKIWQKYGCCLEQDFPYDDRIINQPPNDIALARAERFKIKRYYRATEIWEIQAALSQGYGVVLCIDTNVIGGLADLTGSVIMPYQNYGYTGSHAVACVAYYNNPMDPNDGMIIVKNSWGPEWANNGYFQLAYNFVRDQRLVQEIWIMED